MVKDAYSIPRILDTLDCLQGAVWFTLLDLKSGYWQVEVKEASKTLMAFTVGSLELYKCKNKCCLADECSGDIPAPHENLFG